MNKLNRTEHHLLAQRLRRIYKEFGVTHFKLSFTFSKEHEVFKRIENVSRSFDELMAALQENATRTHPHVGFVYSMAAKLPLPSSRNSQILTKEYRVIEIVQDGDTPEGVLNDCRALCPDTSTIVIIGINNDGSQWLRTSRGSAIEKSFALTFFQAWMAKWFDL